MSPNKKTSPLKSPPSLRGHQATLRALFMNTMPARALTSPVPRAPPARLPAGVGQSSACAQEHRREGARFARLSGNSMFYLIVPRATNLHPIESPTESVRLLIRWRFDVGPRSPKYGPAGPRMWHFGHHGAPDLWPNLSKYALGKPPVATRHPF